MVAVEVGTATLATSALPEVTLLTAVAVVVVVHRPVLGRLLVVHPQVEDSTVDPVQALGLRSQAVEVVVRPLTAQTETETQPRPDQVVMVSHIRQSGTTQLAVADPLVTTSLAQVLLDQTAVRVVVDVEAVPTSVRLLDRQTPVVAVVARARARV